MPRVRHEWRRALPLEALPPRTGACAGLKLRRPQLTDIDALGALMLDAHLGTIDYEGEDLAAAVAVVRGFFEGVPHVGDVAASLVAWRGESPASLCLIGTWAERSCRFVQHIATAPAEKGRGVGRLVLSESLRRLSRAGHAEVRAVITVGNAPSESLFRRLGFEDLGPLAPQAPPPKA